MFKGAKTHDALRATLGNRRYRPLPLPVRNRRRDPENPLAMKNLIASAELLVQLQEGSQREGVSESEIIRKALELYVSDVEEGV